MRGEREPVWAATPLLGAACFAVAAGMVVFHGREEGLAPWFGDAALFYRMADEWPFRPGGWWQYRLLAPWLVHLLPFTTNQGYALLAVGSLGGAGTALASLLRRLGFGAPGRVLGTVLYLSSFVLLYNSYNYAMPDPLAFLWLVLACRAMVRNRHAELAVWLLLGALTKEVVLFLLPARWLWARRRGVDLPEIGRTALIALPALAAFLFFRLQPGEASELTTFVREVAWLNPWRNQPDNLARLYSPFAAGWVLVVLAYRRPDRFALAALGFAVPAFLSLLVTDTGRMLAYLTPFAIPLMLAAAGAKGRVDRRAVAALLLAALSMRLWEPFAPLWRVPVEVRRPLALLLLPVCLVLALRRVSPSSSGPASPAPPPPARA